MTDKYTSPDRVLLQQLTQAPKGIQPTLLKIATNEETRVTTEGPTLLLTIPYGTLQGALEEHQKSFRKDLTIAVSILVSVMAVTATLIILLRG